MLAVTLTASLFCRFLLPVELCSLITKFTVRKVTNSTMIKAAQNYEQKKEETVLLYGPAEWWDTSDITNIGSVLCALFVLTTLDYSNWDLTNVNYFTKYKAAETMLDKLGVDFSELKNELKF